MIHLLTGLLSTTVYKGKYTIDTITLLSSELEENDITEINEIELKFRIYNSKTYQTIHQTDTIRFYAN